MRYFGRTGLGLARVLLVQRPGVYFVSIGYTQTSEAESETD